MTISDVQYTQWLSNSEAVRCILVEVVAKVSGVETTRYLSSTGYTDNVNGRTYVPIVLGSSVSIVEKLNLSSTGQGSLTFGDIQLVNTDGWIDSWLNDVWVNRVCNVYVGDVRWLRADFRPIFLGVTEDIDSKSENTLNLKVRDKLQRLNTPISEQVVGGTSTNKDQVIPLTFGEVFNVTPLLVDSALLKYQVHTSAIEAIIEVRDEGVPVSITNLGDGTFTLLASPFGQITCSVQGDKEGGTTWHTTIANIVERIVTGYGEPANRFIAADLDATQLAAFDALNQEPVGLYIPSRTNVLNACAQVANSVQAQLIMNRLGELRLIKLELPAPGTPVVIDESDILEDSIRISNKVAVEASQKVAFNKNWTTQENLATGIPVLHKEMFAQEWLTVTQEDVAVKAEYRQLAEPTQIDTLLLTEVDASAEATRLLNLYKTPRFVYSFKGTPRLTELQIGDPVTLTHSRFGLSAGKAGQVVSLSINWATLLVDMEVLV